MPRQTSQARAIRWLSVGRRRAAVVGSTSARRACSAAGPDLREQATGFRARLRARIGIWPGLGQRGEIEAGATGQDRQPTCRLRRVHGGERRLAPPGRAARFGGRANAVQRMRHPRLVLRGRSRGEDAKFPIDLHGVGIDDRAARSARPRPAPAPTCRWQSGRRRSGGRLSWSAHARRQFAGLRLAGCRQSPRRP